MKIAELDDASRGADDLDLDPVIAVAERVARAEDAAIFHGFEGGHITGIVEASPHKPVAVNAILDWPRAVVAALETLRAAGMNGPYALALGLQGVRRARCRQRRRLPAAPAHPGEPSRRLARLGAGAPGRRRPPLDPRRRLRADGRAGPVDRLRGPRPDRRRALPHRVVHVPRARGEGGHLPSPRPGRGQGQERREQAAGGARALSRWPSGIAFDVADGGGSTLWP